MVLSIYNSFASLKFASLASLPSWKGCKQANYVNASNMNNTTRAKSHARKKPLFSAHRVIYFVVLDIIENW